MPSVQAPPVEATLAAERGEKRWVALTSVLAALALTTLKVIVGVATGSLGILSEAAHSGLDMIGAILTYLSVSISGKPADADHQYGHGKIENFSAFLITGLLLLTCAWIIWEAFRRLFYTHPHIEPTVWAFGVMLISITIDFFRSRALYRVARKYDSQALEADALHFSTDIWSSSVVILGLALVLAGQRLEIRWLAVADPLAALGVAGIVIYVSGQLGKRTIDALLDAAPGGLRSVIEQAVNGVDGVLRCERVRVRRGGNRHFVDVTISVDRTQAFARVHEISEAVEEAVRTVLPHADVMVHMEPRAQSAESAFEKVRAVALRLNLAVHEIAVQQVDGQLLVDLHLEVPEKLTLGEAHAQATRLENEIRRELPQVSYINTHIETLASHIEEAAEMEELNRAIQQRLAELVRALPEMSDCHAVTVRRVQEKILVSCHCTFDAGLPITRVHDASEELEARLKATFPQIVRVTIHPEPPGEN